MVWNKKKKEVYFHWVNHPAWELPVMMVNSSQVERVKRENPDAILVEQKMEDTFIKKVLRKIPRVWVNKNGLWLKRFDVTVKNGSWSVYQNPRWQDTIIDKKTANHSFGWMKENPRGTLLGIIRFFA